MNLTITTEPPFEPVTLTEAYLHLRIDPEGSPPVHPDDDMILRHITASRKNVELMARRALVQQSLRLSVPGFPVSRDLWWMAPGRNLMVIAIRLLRPPIFSVSSVEYYDGTNTLQTISASDYYITDEQVPELKFVSGFANPTLYDRPDALRVNYTAGYTPTGSPPTTQSEYAANVPEGLKEAILLGVQLLYDNLKPDDYVAVFRAQESLVQPYRIQLTP